MDAAHPLSSPMVVRSLELKKDDFRPCDKGKKSLGPKIPYLVAIGAFMYLANCTRPDIAFAVNLLARFSAKPENRTFEKWLGAREAKQHGVSGCRQEVRRGVCCWGA